MKLNLKIRLKEVDEEKEKCLKFTKGGTMTSNSRVEQEMQN